MATMLERNKNVKIEKKSREDHAEDALYREVWEEVHAQKTYEFTKKYSKYLIAGAIAILVIVGGVQLWRHSQKSAQNAAAANYEVAIDALDANALAGLANNIGGATSDLALFQAYALDKDANKLEQLVKNGKTRDLRDLARIQLAGIKGDTMNGADFEKFMSPNITKRSPFYYTSMLMIAEKYLSENNRQSADIWLDKIIKDKDAPDVISGTATTLK